MVLTANSDYFLNSINQFIFVMVKCGVVFEVRTEFLNNIETSFVFKGLRAFDLDKSELRTIAGPESEEATVGCRIAYYITKGSTLPVLL
jgi:hypothetical protein